MTDQTMECAASSSSQLPEKSCGRDGPDLSKYLQLYKAALKGDLTSSKQFLEQHPDAITAGITPWSETTLHLAVGTGRAIHFVEELVKLMSPEALALQDSVGDTALSYAAMVGNIEAAKLLVNKNPDLPHVMNEEGRLPLHEAALYGHKEMVSYLLTVTKYDIEREPTPSADHTYGFLLHLVIVAGFYDVALDLVQRYPELAGEKNLFPPLLSIASKPSAFPSGSSLTFWESFIYSCIPVKNEIISKHSRAGDVESPADSSQERAQMSSWIKFFRANHFIPACQKLHAVFWDVVAALVPCVKNNRSIKLMHLQSLQLLKCLCLNARASLVIRPALLMAAELGIHEVVEEIVESFPYALWLTDKNNRNIFHLAIMNRQKSVFNLIHQMSEHKHMIAQYHDDSGNNILHLAGNLAPPHQLNLVSGAALQMQLELQWYKEVEKIVQPTYREAKNRSGKKPAMIFTEAHKDLVKEGEKWMKDAANSCTVAAALINSVVFAAAITIPSGNNGDGSLPVPSKERAFIVFAVSDALALFSSITSVLMFLSILTARYAEGDFYSALPKRLIFGFLTLFIAITSMMIAFSATLYLLFGDKEAWILAPITAFACLVVTLFVSWQFPLLVDMIRITYGRGIFRKQSKRLFY